MRRRRFLQAVGVGAAGVGLGLWPRTARADWGDIADAGFWPAGTAPATGILEIYLWGGMAPWESFYYRPVAGSTTRGFDPEVGGLSWNPACPGTPSGLVSQLLAKDLGGAGKDVHLGPFARPLWRNDIRSRMRVVVMQHDLAPHEAAIPYALSGRRLGRPDATGLGAPIQRRARALDTTNQHPLPFSYCLVPSLAIGSPLFNTFDAVGNHGGNAKPVVLPIGDPAAFLASLNRTVPDGADDLLAQYTAQYGNRLKRSGTATRSAAFQDYASSSAGLAAAPALSTLLGGAPLAPGAAAFCSTDTGAFAAGGHFAGSALRTAAYLLNHADPTRRASYVGIIDGGLNNQGFAYDVHDDFFGGTPSQAQRTSSHLWETMSALAAIIRAPGDPPDPGKIDLQSTLIVLKTEFGRTPYRSRGGSPLPASMGRDHWPDGYVNVLIGGPIQTAGVVGSISDGTGNMGQGVAEANANYKPQDIQAAALLGVGIDPFADGNLPVGDLTASLGGSHPTARLNLRQTLLGVV